MNYNVKIIFSMSMNTIMVILFMISYCQFVQGKSKSVLRKSKSTVKQIIFMNKLHFDYGLAEYMIPTKPYIDQHPIEEEKSYRGLQNFENRFLLDSSTTGYKVIGLEVIKRGSKNILQVINETNDLNMPRLDPKISQVSNNTLLINSSQNGADMVGCQSIENNLFVIKKFRGPAVITIYLTDLDYSDYFNPKHPTDLKITVRDYNPRKCPFGCNTSGVCVHGKCDCSNIEIPYKKGIGNQIKFGRNCNKRLLDVDFGSGLSVIFDVELSPLYTFHIMLKNGKQPKTTKISLLLDAKENIMLTSLFDNFLDFSEYSSKSFHKEKFGNLTLKVTREYCFFNIVNYGTNETELSIGITQVEYTMQAIEIFFKLVIILIVSFGAVIGSMLCYMIIKLNLDDFVSDDIEPDFGSLDMSKIELSIIEIDTYIPKISQTGLINRNIDVNNEICTVCINKLDECKNIRIIDICGHIFHSDCLFEWLNINQICPNCKQSLEKSILEEFDMNKPESLDEIPKLEIKVYSPRIIKGMNNIFGKKNEKNEHYVENECNTELDLKSKKSVINPNYDTPNPRNCYFQEGNAFFDFLKKIKIF